MVGVGILVVGVVAYGFNVGLGVKAEFFAGTAGGVGVVVDGNDKVVNAIVMELVVEDDAVPTIGEVECAGVDGSELTEGNRVGSVVEVVELSVC